MRLKGGVLGDYRHDDARRRDVADAGDEHERIDDARDNLDMNGR